MRRVVASALLACTLAGARHARASESADIETDHVDAQDDGGPRLARLAVQPVSPAIGMADAEVAAAIAERLALSAGLGWVDGPEGTGYRISLGTALFPTRAAFHGLYVHPRLERTRTVGGAAWGAGSTVGYAWTWPFGATIVLGAGLAYVGAGAALAPGIASFGSFQPRLDSSVGWLF